MESNVVQRQRDALELCAKEMCRYCEAEGHLRRLHPCGADCEKKRLANEALSIPLRNCDVGTADEQAQRYDKFCEGMDCVKCPVHALWHHYFEICKNRKVSCGLIWAQMPYDADDPAIDQLRYKMEGGLCDGK